MLAYVQIKNKEWNYVKVVNATLLESMSVMAWSPVCGGTSRLPQVHERDPDSTRIHGEKVEKSDFKESNIGDRRGDDHSTNVVEVRRQEAATTAAATCRSRHYFQDFCRFDDDDSDFGRLLHIVKNHLMANDTAMSCDDTKYVAEPESPHRMYFIVAPQSSSCGIKYYMASILFAVGQNLEYPSVLGAMCTDVPKEVRAF